MCRPIDVITIAYLVIASGKISCGDSVSGDKINSHSQIHDDKGRHENKAMISSPRIKRVTEDETEDGFWANRGKKSYNIESNPHLDPYHGGISNNYNSYPQYFDDRPELRDRYEKRNLAEEPFWGNRGKRGTGIEKWGQLTNGMVRRGAAEDIIIPTWPSRGRRSDIKIQQSNRSRREEDEPFWGNRGRRNDDGSVFWGNRGRRSEEVDPFWGNRGKRDPDDDPFWGNRGKRDPDDPFWGNRGKRDPENPFWGNRGKRDPEDPFWGNRGKRDSDDDPFWGNRGKRDPEDVFWGNRGKRDPEEVFWGNRGKRDPEEVFWGNRGKRDPEDPFWGNRGKRDPENPFWGNRGKKDPEEPFWGNRGKKESDDPFWGNRGRRNDEDQFWGARGKKNEEDLFWGNRGKKSFNNHAAGDQTEKVIDESNNDDIHEKYLMACLADILLKTKSIKMNASKSQKTIKNIGFQKPNTIVFTDVSPDESINVDDEFFGDSAKKLHTHRIKRDLKAEEKNLSSKPKDFFIALLNTNPNIKSVMIKAKNLYPKNNNAGHHLSMPTSLIKLSPQAYNGRMDFNDSVKKPNDDELFILDSLPEDQHSLIQQRTRNELDEFATINLNERSYNNGVS